VRPLLLLALVAALACANPLATTPAAYTPPATPTEKVALAVTLAEAITAKPDQAEQILGAHGMTSDQLEDLMADIAADPNMSDAYAAARGK
jgi:hypothetical protein